MAIERCNFKRGDIIDQGWLVKKVLGEGSFGTVYLVEKLHKLWALKLLRLWEVTPDQREALERRFQVEYETSRIDCNCLVRAHHLSRVGGNPYFIMDYCPGGDLTSILGKPNQPVATICRQILTGLGALHQDHKVHRDLKPENVLFKADGTAALTDFGIAGDQENRMTQRNIFGRPDQLFGTYAYMAPEQVARARGGATVMPTTDIWSFGVLLYQMLTGKLPFGSLANKEELTAYLKKSRNGDWDTAPVYKLPNAEKWKAVIGACLVPEVKHRLQSVEQVMELLPDDTPAAKANMRRPVEAGREPRPAEHVCRLVVMSGQIRGKIYNLKELVAQHGRILTIGREESNAIQALAERAGDVSVSERHCCIETNENMDEWIVRDGQWRREERAWKPSTNGTFVNSYLITDKGFYLYNGDRISIGTVKFIYENY